MSEFIFEGISQLVVPHSVPHADEPPLHIVHNAFVWVADGRIKQVGTLAEQPQVQAHVARIDLGGKAVIPGLIDSHTHTVFAGDRVDEMGRRARGETYAQIAAAGGGIVKSVASLTECSQEELFDQSMCRLQRMFKNGVTTLEIKSGYGLSPHLEHKQMRVIEDLASSGPMDIVGTVLAHVIPAQRQNNRQAFIDEFCEQILTQAGASSVFCYCDVFVEQGAFRADEATFIAKKAEEQGLKMKLHVDQLGNSNGAQLAAKIGALSADHLEYCTLAGAEALKNADVVATLLPGCRLFLGKGPWPPARMLWDAGCVIAVATDCNPGSSHIADLPLCGMLASTQCGLTLEESLWSITIGGAKALGLKDRGTFAHNQRADFNIIDHHDWRYLFYDVGHVPIKAVVTPENLDQKPWL
jgi:imidazolonepropionase